MYDIKGVPLTQYGLKKKSDLQSSRIESIRRSVRRSDVLQRGPHGVEVDRGARPGRVTTRDVERGAIDVSRRAEAGNVGAHSALLLIQWPERNQTLNEIFDPREGEGLGMKSKDSNESY